VIFARLGPGSAGARERPGRSHPSVISPGADQRGVAVGAEVIPRITVARAALARPVG
jgi:hypothetical protein